MHQHVSRALAIAAALFIAAGALARADKAPRPSLAGSWTFNPGLSDQRSAPQPKQGRFRMGPPRSGYGGAGPIGGAGMGGPMMQGQYDPELIARSKEITRIGVEAPDSLTIEGTDPELVITTETGHSSRLRTDGSKTYEVSEGGLELVRKTKWDHEKLVMEMRPKGGGGFVKQTLTREGDRLVLESVVETDVDPRPIKLRHVYDKEE